MNLTLRALHYMLFLALLAFYLAAFGAVFYGVLRFAGLHPPKDGRVPRGARVCVVQRWPGWMENYLRK